MLSSHSTTVSSSLQAARGPDPFHVELMSIVQGLESLLAPALQAQEVHDFLKAKVTAPAVPASTTASGRPGAAVTKGGTATPASSSGSASVSSLVLLLDKEFLDLPMEGLKALEGFKGVSRDFSLHFLHHRLAAAKEVAGGK